MDDLGEHRAALLDVLGHGDEEVVDAVETQGRADVLDELHDDALVIEVEVVAVEDIGLDGATVLGVEGRVGPDGDRGRHGAVGLTGGELEAGQPTGIHTLGRDEAR